MRIAIFYELAEGGAKRAAEELAIHLSARHHVELFIVGRKPSRTFPKMAHIHTYRIPFSTKHIARGGVSRVYSDTIALLQIKYLHRHVAEIIDAQTFDCVLVHPSRFTQAPYILRFLKTPSWYYCQEPLRIVYDPLCSRIDSSLSMPKRAYEWTNRLIRKHIDNTNLRTATHILCSSKYVQAWIFDAYKKNATIVPLGVDEKIFRHMPKVRKNVDLLFVGEQTPIEGFDLFLALTRVLPKTVRARVISYRTPNLSVTDEQLVLAYNQANIVLALGRHEPFGLIPLEAMSCGTSVVALREGGYAETVLHEKTGILVDVSTHTVQKLRSAVEYLLSHAEERKKMGERARNLIHTQWSWAKSVKTLEHAIVARSV